MKRVLKGIFKLLKAHKNKLAIAGAVTAAAFIPGIALADDSGDLLSSQQQTVNSTFGHGSSLEKWFYMTEVFLSLITYFKVRTPMVFIGLVMVIIFTRIGFGLIG
jgi:type IV conjugative transfer system pilin TraA